MEPNKQALPVIRSFPRFKLDIRIAAFCEGYGGLLGWCHNISEGGACVTLGAPFQVGQQLRLELPVAGQIELLELPAVVRHVNGNRYGIEFLELTPEQRRSVSLLGENHHTTAYIMSSRPVTIRVLQRLLQQIGVSHVAFGCPKVLPPLEPCLVVVDGDWPDYLETIQFLRGEAGPDKLVIVALLTPTADLVQTNRNGADLIAFKPATGSWVQRILATAFDWLKRGPQPAVASGEAWNERDFAREYRVDAQTARTQFGKIMDRAVEHNERFVVERRGEPAVVIMSVQDFIRTAAPPHDWLQKDRQEAKRPGVDKLLTTGAKAESAAPRRERKRAARPQPKRPRGD